MRFSVLGPLEVETAAGERIVIGSAKQRAVLAMLLARTGSVVTIGELVDGLWGDNPPPSAVPSLRTYVSRLRKLVDGTLVGHDDGYSLDLTTAELDASIFEHDVAHARYTAALGHWRGRPYGDAADLPVVRGEVLRLEALAAAARAGQIEEWLRAGRPADAIAAAEALLAEDPTNETAWSGLVQALDRSGRKVDALRAFQRAARELAEAGLEPSATLRSAEAEVLSDRSRAVDSRRRVPPTPLSACIGRQAEIDRLAELTASRRLTTIVGPGGVGKTRLAIEVGRSTAPRHELGARVVELSRIDEPAAIGPAVRRALDLTGGDAQEAIELGSIDALLILDNCEHLVDAVAAHVATLMAGGDALRVLATSREPLGIPGEQRWALAPLSTIGAGAPAIELFAERARDLGVSVDADDPAVGAIVHRLDGLPLALEMAAARLATLGLADLADSLERSVASLGGHHRTVDERHGTLGDVVAWSETLLTPELREALADFSIFAGPVGPTDLPAALATDHPLDAVSVLVERSLVTVDTSTGDRARYGSLETVRQVGRERLREQGRTDIVARRHARWFATVADEAATRYDSDDEAAAVARLDGILDELRAAHHWSRTHDPALALRLSDALYLPALQGLRIEVFEWMRALAELVGPSEDGAARLYGQLAEGLTLAGRLDDARRWAHAAIAAADRPADCHAAHAALADIATYTGDLERAVEAARRNDELASEAGTGIEQAMARATLAVPLAYRGCADDALAVIPTDLPGGAAPSAHAWLAYARGEALIDLDPLAAQCELDTAVTLAESVGNHFLSAVAQVSAATSRVRHGEAEDAVGPLWRTIDALVRRGDVTHLLTTLRNVPTLLVRLRAWEPAAEILGGVSGESTSPTYGAEAERLADVGAAAQEQLGADRFAAAHDLGARRSLRQTAEVALSALDRLRAGPR